MHRHPSAFMSYSWDNADHKRWVARLATRLRRDGVNVLLDRWRVAPGESFAAFMEQAIRTCDFVLIVCTPKYKAKADSRDGGVGYETEVMTAEFGSRISGGKFIPILRSGKWDTAAPMWIRARFYLDFRGEQYSATEYQNLLFTLYDIREQEPALGDLPADPALRCALQMASKATWLMPEDEALRGDERVESPRGMLLSHRHLRPVAVVDDEEWPTGDAA
jgi:hypothetical protein